MLNKDFLKEILIEAKRFLPLSEVSWVNVPLYEELSVIKLWPMVRSDEQFAKCFPTKLPKDRVPDRDYFFNILNTFQPNYLRLLIEHANK
jgi:hypothetical protein